MAGRPKRRDEEQRIKLVDPNECGRVVLDVKKAALESLDTKAQKIGFLEASVFMGFENILQWCVIYSKQIADMKQMTSPRDIKDIVSSIALIHERIVGAQQKLAATITDDDTATMSPDEMLKKLEEQEQQIANAKEVLRSFRSVA